MSQLVNFKCPNCGGPITFSSAQQQMVCPYCQSVLSPEVFHMAPEQMPSHMPDDASAQHHWAAANQPWLSSDELEQLRVYSCNSCAGEIVSDSTQGATSCPFCGNPVIMGGVFSGDLKPDLIIPFKQDKNAAVEALNNLYKNKRLLPKVFSSQNHIDEIKGIYVPFWLYSSDVLGEVYYAATRVRMWTDRRYEYTETSHYDVFRSGTTSYQHVPVDGAAKIKNILTESIEPFDYRDLTEFKLPYLSGFFANRYDVDAGQSAGIATSRMDNSTKKALAATAIGYNTLVEKSSRLGYRNDRVLYALLPVWMLTTIWQDKPFTFAMNGQTGKIAGDDLPTDWGIFWIYFFTIMLGVTGLLFLLLRLIIQ